MLWKHFIFFDGELNSAKGSFQSKHGDLSQCGHWYRSELMRQSFQFSSGWFSHHCFVPHSQHLHYGATFSEFHPRWRLTEGQMEIMLSRKLTYVFQWTPCDWRRWPCLQRDSTSASWLQPLRRPLSHCACRSVSSTCGQDDEQSTSINQRR